MENYESKYIPTIEEMYQTYKLEKRKAINKENNNISDEGSFFNTFRKSNKESEDIFINHENNTYYLKFKNYILSEYKNKGKSIKDIENLINYEQFFLNWERKVNKKNKITNSTSSTRYRVDKINILNEELNSLLNSSREAFIFYNKRKLLEDLNNQKEGKLINIPYVLRVKEKIIKSFYEDMPVYLVGHLGSGKTQIATEACIEYTISRNIQNELEIHLTNWFKENPNKNEDDAILEFSKEFNKRNNFYKNILKSGTSEEVKSLYPLFISGSYNLTYEDMFVEKTLFLKHSFSKGSFSDYLEMIISDFYEWMDKHNTELKQMTNEEQLNLKIQIWKSFSDLLVAKNSAFGTEIKKIEKEILIAIKEGKPVIVDELNTIAMENLIGLNDILQKHIGSKAYITGVGPVTIKDGFSFIGTGNLSTNQVSYEGTNELNPAFKSRFITIEYNYPEQNIIGSLNKQVNKEENELFRIIISRLTDKHGNLILPNINNTLDELFSLAQLSKLTQNIFMGKWMENTGLYKDFEEVYLKESVLSIRNIFHVLDNWNLGEEKDLSSALWDGFISSITNPDDQNYIISQAVKFGFFKKEDGWNIDIKSIGDSLTNLSEIRDKNYKYIRPEIQSISYLETIELIFGSGPKIKNIPDKLKSIFKDSINKQNIDIDKYQQLDYELSKLEHSINLLEYIENLGEDNED